MPSDNCQVSSETEPVLSTSPLCTVNHKQRITPSQVHPPYDADKVADTPDHQHQLSALLSVIRTAQLKEAAIWHPLDRQSSNRRHE